eukprot:CAMPEP_0178480164 /NCGR_PEP_ID=MMETSP0696-20121128/5559_1 /TAXON_ID=265572 /ORGANISM="Extubocellulus spinifer, Strain CCMP396" /LENGTH=303 /DNA_ID=CAMNT_0020107605 /DNA_START=82 /DNA_END=993 /DNA_ORIENTATION=+
MKFVSSLILGALAAAASAAEIPEFVRQLQEGVECAVEGQRSQECGAVNPDRPATCCEGLFCQKAVCVSSLAECAAQGEKAIECGIAQTSRPETCCEGLVCDALKTCQPIGEVPTAEPTVFIPPTALCASAGDRAQDCGATNTARPQSCCGDLICEEGAGVRCVDPNAAAPTTEEVDPEVDPDDEVEPTAAPTDASTEDREDTDTAEPTAGAGLDEPTGVPGTAEPTPSTDGGIVAPPPVAAPTVDAMMPEPTAEPTMPTEDTTDPTAMPTDASEEEVDPTSSAGAMGSALAVSVAAVAVPLFL